MPSVASNSINCHGASGLVNFDGTSIFSTTALTQHDVLVGGSANTVVSVGPGTAGQILQSGGASSDPAYSTAVYPSTAGSSGNILTSDGTNFVSSANTNKIILIQSQTASASASLTFSTNTSLYSQILVTFYGIQPATNAATFTMQMSNNGGSTWVTTGYNTGVNVYAYNSATGTNLNSTSAYIITGGQVSGSANSTTNGQFYIFNANVGAQSYTNGSCVYWDSTGANAFNAVSGGRLGSTGANAFKFLMSAGNITAGTITLYGIKTA